MSKRKPKTFGTEWLYLSMASFNGSGYADKTSPKAYYQSYITYKSWKKDKKAVQLAKLHEIEALYFSDKLCQAAEAGHVPSEKAKKKFEAYTNKLELL